jgi:hypothetical protein
MLLTGHEQRLVNQLRAVGVRLEAMPLDRFDECTSAITSCFTAASQASA